MNAVVGELAAFVRGEVVRGTPESPFRGGVSIDSRTLAEGDLFVAIKGPRHDGHDFVAEALRRGAAGVLISDPLEVDTDAFVIRAADTTRALQDLAWQLRRRSDLRVVAITGSMGKTTTKECAAAALGARYRVLKSEGNLNNHYGLPLSILKLRDENAAVLEMGMSAPGEIARLTEIAEPDVGVLTNVAEAHLEYFGSVEAIAEAKGELFAGLRSDAVAVVNADDPLVLREARRFPGRQIQYALRADVELRAREVRETADGVELTAERHGESVRVRSRLAGAHNAYNLLAGLAAALALEVSLAPAAQALASVAPGRHRGERIRLASGVVLVDETYNANPRAVLAVVGALTREERAGRRIAVLGDMLELGASSEAIHRRTGGQIASHGLDHLVGVGALGAEIVAGARDGGMPPERLTVAATPEEAGRLLAGLLRPGDVVLFKASRGLALEGAIDSLREEASR